MWRAVSLVHGMLATRRQYFLTTDAETRLSEQLSLLPLLQDWVPTTAYEVSELTAMLRTYLEAADGDADEAQVDKAASAVSYCVRVMTMNRARSAST
jgi:hypothetical protein